MGPVNIQIKLLSSQSQSQSNGVGGPKTTTTETPNGTSKPDHQDYSKSNIPTFEYFTSGNSAEFLFKFKDFAQSIKPYWALLLYPSDLHYIGRTFAMTVVTGTVLYQTALKFAKDWDGSLTKNVYLVEDPGSVGLDKEF